MQTSEPDVTLCITSCGRLKLLKETLNSFMPSNGRHFSGALLTEDANSLPVQNWLGEKYPDIKVFMNSPKLGHLRSVDLMYEHVNTPYIFHGEDDWLSDNQDIIEDCKKVLDNDPSISVACVRVLSDFGDKKISDMEFKEVDGVRYGTHPLDDHPKWGAFTFNPALLKRSLWEKYGPYKQYKTEAGISIRMKQDGLKIAYLDPGCCDHIGADDHVADPFQGSRYQKLVKKFANSFEKRKNKLIGMFGK